MPASMMLSKFTKEPLSSCFFTHFQEICNKYLANDLAGVSIRDFHDCLDDVIKVDITALSLEELTTANIWIGWLCWTFLK
jgi:hypothetical protein